MASAAMSDFENGAGNISEKYEIDPNNQQFSNNATSLEIPVVVTHEISSNDTKPVAEKGIKEESELKEPQKTDSEFNDRRKPTTEPPVVTTPDDVTSEDNDDDADYIESAGDERIACIEEEYIQRISILEQRHNELENVLERLTTAVECGIVNIKPQGVAEITPEDTVQVAEKKEGTTGGEPEKNETDLTRGLILDLFVEFQHKIRNFAEDLNGVLNCSEAAIRHARVVQEWATSVQLMFEQLKEERHKILNYIDERERNMMVIKEQFVAELEEQGKTLKQLVEEMMSHHELQKEGEEYCKTKGDSASKRSTVEKIVDLLLKRRLEEDKSIILNLNKQSKISEMKLFIIHQQSCIQQLQEQNKELRAIIEGLMGPDEIEEENPCDSDQSGTPASVSSQEQCLLRQTLEKQDSPSISLVSDVLYCDRGEYLPGGSTDGDVATVQAYGIGRDADEVNTSEEIVFDPLSVNYVREQCQLAEETERQAHLTVQKDENVQPVTDSCDCAEKDKVKQEPGAENDKVEQEAGAENDKVEEETSTENDEVEQETGVENDKVGQETDVENDKVEQETDAKNDEVEQETGAENDKVEKEAGVENEKVEQAVEPATDRADEHNAAGDGIDVINEKTISPETDDKNSTENKEDVL
ncbi:uncharacterized protein LOC123536970 isoform X2 [Mercenaria mercenaria]|uniref:uncharacterized protein LOC123536970 isoform X2 n=1 Tax=Mercenaria mercenaria TaxID=6596 RepID=UPI00234ED7D3|nr:uncharacterized protein LOC123536970 isoform X2 [Mercenaria mercenaria]